MEFVLRRQGKELDEVGTTPVAPRLRRNRPSVDLDLKSAKQPHRAPPDHPQVDDSAPGNGWGTRRFQTSPRRLQLHEHGGKEKMAISTNEALVDTDSVARNLGRKDMRLLDVDEDTEAYGRGHIEGALGIHWKNDLQDPLRRDFIGPVAFAELMDRFGITNDTLVVLYGGNNNWFAAYAYWYFKYYGHGSVRLMDGGRKKWELEKRPVTQEPAHVASTSGYRTGGPIDDIRAKRKMLEDEVVGHSRFGLVDVRSPEEYRGELLAPPHLPQEQAQKPGHIPGAKNIPWARAVNPQTGAFLPVADLKALYEGQGITPEREVIAYCRIGERSAHTWFALHELLGYPHVRNYDGSWTEWGSLVGVPIER
jgi:thiosulfate/3-mercaptopyruvate sulfurtransferase